MSKLFGVLLFSTAVAMGGPQIASAQTGIGSPCLLQYQIAGPEGYSPCAAAFRTSSARLLARYVSSAFQGNAPNSFALLRDGTLMVGTDRQGLFRIDQRGRVATLWAPRDCDECHVTLFAPYAGGVFAEYDYGWVVGIRSDGTFSYGPWTFATAGAMFDNVIGPDTDGAAWFAGSTSGGRRVVYVLNLATKAIQRVSSALFDKSQVFLSTDGHAYSRNGTVGITELRGIPSFQTHFVHPPLPDPPPPPPGSEDGSAFTWFVAPDGSSWGSTSTQILHLHADGRFAITRLARPMTRGCNGCLIFIREAPDGSAFYFVANRAIHITTDDRVEVIQLPDMDPQAYYAYPTAFAPDGTLWYISIDQQAHLSALVHVRL